MVYIFINALDHSFKIDYESMVIGN